MRKLDHLQILRAVAASLVIVAHALQEAPGSGNVLGALAPARDFAGVVGVDAFFILSGLIMTLQTYHRFGERAVPLAFAYRRIVRIVPMYWIATLLAALFAVHSGALLVSLKRVFVLSLLFIPNVHSKGFAPILAQGWTLNAEVAFYAMFTLALFLPRRFGILTLVLIPEVISLAGQRDSAAPGFHPVMLDFYRRDEFLFMARGVLLGWLLNELKTVPTIKSPASPALLLGLPTFLMIAFPGFLVPPFWGSLLPFCFVIVVLCSIADQEHFSWFGRMLILLGDASYSTYLFHAFFFGALDCLVATVSLKLHREFTSPQLYVVISLVACNLIGLGIHLAVERPILKALRRWHVHMPRLMWKSETQRV